MGIGRWRPPPGYPCAAGGEGFWYPGRKTPVRQSRHGVVEVF